jgi:MFS transporter, DHA3 family, tetracycline resistance protein
VVASLFQRRDAYRVFLAMEGASALFWSLMVTLNMVYQVTVVKLDPLQLVLVGTVLETVVFVCEIPTGVVADVYSRRLSIIIGLVLIGVGFTLEGTVPRFGAVLMAQVLWGFGYTFTSGATEAWIADEVGDERASVAFVRGAQVGQIGAIIGIVASVALGSINVRLPIILGGVAYMLLGVALIAVMPEHGFTPVPPEERESWRGMFRTFGAGLRLVRGRAVLLVVMGVALFTGLASEGFDRLWTAHLLDQFTFPAWSGLDPVIWFGILGVVTMLFSLVTTEIVRRRVDVNDARAVLRTLLVSHALIVVAMFIFGSVTGFGLAIIAYLTVRVMHGVSGPIFTAWINPHIDSNVRATVFSMSGQVNAIGQIAGGPGVGLIGRDVSVRAALLTSAGLLVPVLGLFGIALRRTPAEPVPAVVAVAAEG